MSSSTRVLQLHYYLIHASNGGSVEVKESLTVGREVGALTFPSDQSMSRTHFKIFIQGGQCFIEDLGSTNKTYVNGRPVEPKTPVQVHFGDEIYSGTQRFILNREPHLPEAKIAIPTPVQQPTAPGRRVSDAPSAPIPSHSEVFSAMFRPSEWTSFDRYLLICSLLILGTFLFLFFKPVHDYSRWKPTQFDTEEFLELCFIPVLTFWVLFYSAKRSPKFIEATESSKKLRAIFLGSLVVWAFAPQGEGWQQAAREDLKKSCFTVASRDPEQCKQAMKAAASVDRHLTSKGFALVAQFIPDQEFLQTYAQDHGYRPTERAPATDLNSVPPSGK